MPETKKIPHATVLARVNRVLADVEHPDGSKGLKLGKPRSITERARYGEYLFRYMDGRVCEFSEPGLTLETVARHPLIHQLMPHEEVGPPPKWKSPRGRKK